MKKFFFIAIFFAYLASGVCQNKADEEFKNPPSSEELKIIDCITLMSVYGALSFFDDTQEQLCDNGGDKIKGFYARDINSRIQMIKNIFELTLPKSSETGIFLATLVNKLGPVAESCNGAYYYSIDKLRSSKAQVFKNISQKLAEECEAVYLNLKQ